MPYDRDQLARELTARTGAPISVTDWAGCDERSWVDPVYIDLDGDADEFEDHDGDIFAAVLDLDELQAAADPEAIIAAVVDDLLHG